MKYQSTCLLMLATIAAYGYPSEATFLNATNDFKCQLNMEKIMNFLYVNQCVQIIVNIRGSFPTNCVADMMKLSRNVTTYTRSIEWIMRRNIYSEKIISESVQNITTRFCENYLIFLDNVPSITSIVLSMDPQNTTKNFFPFSKIYFLIENMNFSSNEQTKQISNIFHNRSLFGYIVECDDDGGFKLLDLLTLNYTLAADYPRSNLLHPFLDRKNAKKVFRISFHECFPYVIYVDEKNLRFDGTEYRLVEEVVKNWKVEYLFRDWSKTQQSPYVTMFGDLRNHSADISMGAVWLTDHFYQFDLTTFHSHECNAMLVPKPTRLNEATAIYTTFSPFVWMIFGVCFSMTAFLLWRVAKTKIVNNNRYTSLVRTFLDLTNVTTSHGLGNLPDQNSIKIILLSWTLLSYWIGISYSTIYTSRLTSPLYTKLVDTLEDFLSNELYWGTHFFYPDMATSLQRSANPRYHELHKGVYIFKDRADAETRLKSGKCCVLGGISRNKYFYSYDWSKELHLFTNFRLMKKSCILNYYSVFTLQKFSPYTELFSEHALGYQEHGFSEYFYSVLYRDKRWYETFFEDYPPPDNEPKALTVRRLIGALIVLLLGSVLAAVTFLFEWLRKWNK